MYFALFALAIGAFCIGTTEFVTAGILPNIASYFGISIPAAGLLTSVYAISVTVSAPLLTIATIKLPRKQTLTGLMGLFIVGSGISALASSYETLMLGRIVTALCHGAFFGIGTVVATSLVSENKRARAIAFMFSGFTIANVAGVPISTWIGQHLGWRAVFWGITALGTIGLLGIIAFIPRASTISETNLRKEFALFTHKEVWLALLVTTFGCSGVFASLTYIAPLLTNITGFLPSSITGLLILFGIGLVAGNTIGGKAADHALTPSLYTFLILLAIILALFTVTAHYKVLTTITLFLFGIFSFAIVAPLQIQLMQHAREAPTLASTANISAFNLGNAGGVFFGGIAINQGLGYLAPNWVGATLTLIGLLLALIVHGITRKHHGPPLDKCAKSRHISPPDNHLPGA